MICPNDNNLRADTFIATFYRDNSNIGRLTFGSTTIKISSPTLSDAGSYTCKSEGIDDDDIKFIFDMSDPVFLHVRDIGELSLSFSFTCCQFFFFDSSNSVPSYRYC